MYTACVAASFISMKGGYNPIEELNIITLMNLGFLAWLLDFISFKQAYLINWQHWNQYLISKFYWLK